MSQEPFAGKRIRADPTFLHCTESPSKRHSFGILTAWLPPLWNIFATFTINIYFMYILLSMGFFLPLGSQRFGMKVVLNFRNQGSGIWYRFPEDKRSLDFAACHRAFVRLGDSCPTIRNAFGGSVVRNLLQNITKSRFHCSRHQHP